MLKVNTPIVISNVLLPTEKDEEWLHQDRNFIEDGECYTVPECEVNNQIKSFHLFYF